MKKNFLGALTVLTVSSVVLGTAQAESSWKSAAELGLILTDGNTTTRSTNGKLNVENERDQWRHSAALEALRVSDENATTAERYNGKAKSAYKFSEFNYVFIEGNGEHDKFSGYDYRASLVAGYGRRVLQETNMRLDLEVGPGYRQSKPDTEEAEGEGVFQLSGKYEWDISKTAKFSEELTTQVGEEATLSKSITSLTANINSDFAMKTTLTLRHASETPENVDELDTELGVTLVYNF